MSDSGDSVKYKWTPESTSLLVSVWSDKQVQKQLEYATKPQLIWESVARYMRKKGYNVSAKQCRSRMKQVLVCYRESKRSGTRAGVEQYYDSIDRVYRSKGMEHVNVNGIGIDTVDAAVNVKSPPKDVKTNKNLQMRHQFREPVQSLYRTEALSPTWITGQENEYPDSPESNETIVARPYFPYSPTRDVAINTIDRRGHVASRNIQHNRVAEEPIRENFRQNLLTHYPYGEIPFQNTVQNVQNHIIQENMQQNQNMEQTRLQNHLPHHNVLIPQHAQDVNMMGMQRVNDVGTTNILPIHNGNIETILRHQNVRVNNNQAVPQEPRKVAFGQHVAINYKQYRDALQRCSQIADLKQNGSLSPDYSPDVSQNLNDAFCQSKSDTKSHTLNETFNQPIQVENQILRNMEASVLTNNATCNDDSLLLEFMLDSPTPSETDCKSRNTAVNTDMVPNVPLRKKKAQKLEQLVLNAINSQNEVVNKILAVQNDMVSRFLDIDRDRQNRLENRLDQLLNVVHAKELNKNSETEPEFPIPPSEPTIINLAPPPKPGAVPPKLDLVPPKPCRVPCTVANANIELVNQEHGLTRPGVISPITSPGKTVGTIWSKLGPVSQSPFVKAQQRLGLQSMGNSESRTQSSAERRIAKEVGKMETNMQVLILEITKFLEMERLQEEKIQNARLEKNLGQSLTARRKLFTQREPSAAIIITAAFLEAECRASELEMDSYNSLCSNKGQFREVSEDKVLAGQGEGYDRLRRANTQTNCLIYEPTDSSTPAKPNVELKPGVVQTEMPKQTIQQLAQLVMNSARWRDAALDQQRNSKQFISNQQINEKPSAPPPILPASVAQRDVQHQAFNLITNQPDNGDQLRGPHMYAPPSFENRSLPKPRFPMGFTTEMLDDNITNNKATVDYKGQIGLMPKGLQDRKQANVRFMDDALVELQRMYIQRNMEDERRFENQPFRTNNGIAMIDQNRHIVDRCGHDALQKRGYKDKNTDSDDEEYLDTTTSIHLPVASRRGSLTSTGTTSTGIAHPTKVTKSESHNCIVS